MLLQKFTRAGSVSEESAVSEESVEPEDEDLLLSEGAAVNESAFGRLMANAV